MTDPQVIVNLGTGGSDLNGQNGSTSSADSNDAQFLDWPGDNAGNYVYLPGVSGNYLLVPDEAALDITGDIDIRVQVAMDDWTPSADMSLIEKYVPSSDQRSWRLFLDIPSNTLRFSWSTDGTSGGTTTVGATTAPTVSNGESLWVRVTFDVDNGASGNDAKFYTSTDGSSWSQLGSTVTTAGTASIYSSTANVNIGEATIGPAAGKFYRAQILDGIGGTTVLDIDTSVITSGSAASFAAATGQTVTINRSTSGRKSVAVVSPVWLFGTDDRMEVGVNPLFDLPTDEDATLLVIFRQWDTQGSFYGFAGVIDSPSGLSTGLMSYSRTYPQVGIQAEDDTSANVQIWDDNAGAGTLNIAGGVVDRAAQTLKGYENGVAIGSPSSIASLGRLDAGSGTNFFRVSGINVAADFEFLGVAFFRRALTAAEVAAISTYYRNRLS